MKKTLLISFSLLLIFHGYTQQFGGNASNIKWMKIKSESANIIFQKKLDSAAQRIAAVIEQLNSSSENSIGTRQKKINLVLQNQTTISNGYVGLGPFRSEFYLTPEQNSFELGSLPWTDQLAVHEFRHVQQYNNFNVGLSKALSVVFGQEGQALANNAAIPNWFFEGDAVYNETRVTQQGRGRLPYFFNDYRALWKENKNYSWMKLRNGSYKDFVPDHYATGYLLVAYGYEKYGADFWKNVTHDAAAYKGLFYPFQTAIKKYSGKNYVQFRNDALNYFKDNFADAKSNTSVKHNDFQNEQYPVYINGTDRIYVKTTFKEPATFYLKNSKGEKKIRMKDVSLDEYFSYKNGKIIYASYVPDKRWSYKDYSDIQLLDINTGTQKTLTRHTKYFSPDISEDGQQIVAVNVSPNGNTALHILNAQGKIISELPNSEKLFYTYPKFYNRQSIISAVRNKSGQMSMALINSTSGMVTYLLPFGFNVIGFPAIKNDTVYFSASHSKVDKIFAFIVSQNKLLQMQKSSASSGTGAYAPAVSDDKISWTTFTTEGFKLEEQNLSSIEWLELSNEAIASETSDFFVPSINKNATLLNNIKAQNFPVSKYHEGFNLFNFHSIEPDIDDPKYTLTLVGENILSTLQSQISFTYDRAERSKTIGASLIYAGLYPFLSAGVNYTFDRAGLYQGNPLYWNETEIFGGINLPLNLSKGRSFTTTNIGSQYVFNQTNYTGNNKGQKYNYSYLNNSFSLTHQLQKVRQNIFPKFAQSLQLNYKTAVTNFKGNQFLANAHLYLPSFAKNHSLVLNGAYLIKDTLQQINFSSGFPFSRGYQAATLHEMYKWSIDYHFPLVYPDFGIGNIVYFSRIRNNFFYDYTNANDFYANGSPFDGIFRTAGVEIYFDTKWWNQESITFGLRYSRLLDKDLFGATGNNRWEIILPVNIFHN